MRRIIDMHQHIGGENTADALAATYKGLGVVKALLAGLPPSREPGNNEAVLEAWRKYPDLFMPYIGFEMDGMGLHDLDDAKEAGFVGVKFIAPKKPYNDDAYFPVYGRAAALGMPVLFHLGIVANYGRWSDCDSGLMRPIHLDHIARTHPTLRILGAHFGNPWCDEAAMACRWNPNLFFDLSGSTLKYRGPDYIGGLLWWTPRSAYRSPDRTHAWQKIVFGSDVGCSEVQDVIHDYEVLMAALKLSPELQESVWYGAAARLLGLEVGKAPKSRRRKRQ